MTNALIGFVLGGSLLCCIFAMMALIAGKRLDVEHDEVWGDSPSEERMKEVHDLWQQRFPRG